ncbi:trimethyllysine dioxygenase TmlH [Aspergillus ellipticus CBS 707.79]|uniref:Trimethyllysine dioxygenase n=1 Tax=Aspergillus ellipticus CBS 707.79 TaxID=1448320 RepID=A0A319CSC4_9EURO|nr:trimethyllysine dioxygenase TmlH [Aspergillus ellipticus CBS 707.79]
MSAPGVGHEFPPQEVSWQKRDVLLFANSIGCKADELHFLYELHPNFSVFPTYSLILPFKLTDQEVTDFYARSGGSPIPGVPNFDYRRVVDGQRKLTVLKPLPPMSAGKQFELRNKVVGVYDKGKAGTVLETEQSIVEKATGEVYSKIVTSSFFVGQGNWGGPKGPSTLNYAPPEGRKPDAVHTIQSTMETAHLYRLNGDYNPLHATPEPGAKMGFGGIIIHGLFSWNSAAHGILRELGGSDPKNLKEFQARFASPVRPGDKLTTEIWRTGTLLDGYEEIRSLHFASSFTPRRTKSRCEVTYGLPGRLAPARARSSTTTEIEEELLLDAQARDQPPGYLEPWERASGVVNMPLGNDATHQARRTRFGSLWLRDHCPCPKCVHPDTRQRIVDTFSIPEDIRPLNITRAQGIITINWSDGHASTYPIGWLIAHKNRMPHVVKKFPALDLRPFKSYNPKLLRHRLPQSPYNQIMNDEQALFSMLDDIYTWGFTFVKHVPVDPESTEGILDKIAFTRRTHYGGFWDFTADLSFKDTAYTNEPLGLHTDNTYFTDPARLQLFHLLSHDGEGGDNLLVDGFQAAAILREESPEHCRILMETDMYYHASGNEGVCIQPVEPAPVFKVHPVLKRLYQIRWNNYDRAPKSDWSIEDQQAWYAAARHWDEILQRDNVRIRNYLQPGTAIIFDNWRMLHGRTQFTGKRRLCGGYVNNDDFLSRYRLLLLGRERLLDFVGSSMVSSSNPLWYV